MSYDIFDQMVITTMEKHALLLPFVACHVAVKLNLNMFILLLLELCNCLLNQLVSFTEVSDYLVYSPVTFFCSAGGESDLQKRRNNCRQSKVRRQMMELCLPCDNTVWKRIWAEEEEEVEVGGRGF